ncbi:CaiB/BaiF CoA transferase family protein [Pseudofrankia inefficax]|uniref:L-carnitine dehydratase/bile acid-inducible protein F n=1 Tax=Pseudofrankia inefficax (strain DSM 45817 / CECT 9037 / DDB 130130 / EuI1c) TaxID=298654 RepID=E3IZR8_PSEI1|nr:CoA transferase [Pseudofrankia inefficax]ADP83986.1 L-carnitine dehydratase/bile acid-inducible protein F [Pseudofrankia inefficax]
MTSVMEGVRVLEVAEHTFVPAASALLSDLGADVIKIEHVERGDAMRGLASTGTAFVPSDVHVLLEHSNRGKRSLALDIATPEGAEILYQLAATSDVFLTNKLPHVRAKLHIEVDDIRAHNPDIIYVRGTGQGERGPDADKGSYDGLAFWARAGVAMGIMQPEHGQVPYPPGPGFGDSIGAMAIAGGIAMALYHRERTSEATVVDVSLLSSAMWAMAQAIGLSVNLGRGWAPPPIDAPRGNPLVGTYRTKDGRWLSFSCLQAARYWPPFCESVGRGDLATDPRFADHSSLMAHSDEAARAVGEVIAQRTVDEWRDALKDFIGQWTVVQDTLEAARDPQSIANGYLQPCETAAGVPFEMVAAPVQFDEKPAAAGRAPEFNEHGDAILTDLGLDWEKILDLKVRGIIA